MLKETNRVNALVKGDCFSFKMRLGLLRNLLGLQGASAHSLEPLSGDATSIGATIQYYYGRRMPISCPLELCYLLWQGECNKRFEELKANEEELNRIFIDIYGLQDETDPDVDDKDVTVRKADLSRDIRSLISYAVGCMMGRYSLDKPGLAFAGGAWDASQYDTYPADKDGILPITDDEYFADDIVTMFVNWLKTVYGADTLEENLRFISDALGGKGSPREVIRNYFLNDFYKGPPEGLPETPHLLAVRQRQEERLQGADLYASLSAGHHRPCPHGLCT